MEPVVDSFIATDDTELNEPLSLLADETFIDPAALPIPSKEFNSSEQCRKDTEQQLNIQRDRLREIVEDEKIIDIYDPLQISESGKLLKDYILMEGFGDHHIAVFDNWIRGSVYNNIYGRKLKMLNGNNVFFENFIILTPRYARGTEIVPLTPKFAIEQGVTYGCDWQVNVVLRDPNGDIVDSRPVCIGNIPVMLKSQYCILHGKTPRELALFGQDPKDPGGYFIVEGVEKIVLGQEQLTVDKILLMHINTKGSVVVRMTANTIRGTEW